MIYGLNRTIIIRMVLYQNSVVYKLKKNDDYDDVNIYIGSTSNFKNRKNVHKSACNNENMRSYNKPAYLFIRDNGGWDEWVMIPIEEWPCENKNQLEIRERYWIDFLKPKLNKVVPTRTGKEYREVNKDKIKEYREVNKDKFREYRRQYYEDNKDKLNERMKQYRADNKEKLAMCDKKYYEDNQDKIIEYRKQYYERNKDKIKEYREENKELITKRTKERYENNKEQIKQKYQNNKDKIKEYRKVNKDKIREYRRQHREVNKEKYGEKVKCDHCGAEVRKDGFLRHKKSNKCQNTKKDQT